MEFDEVLERLRQLLGQDMSQVRIDILRETWNERDNDQIARILHRDIKDTAAELWQLLSQRLGIKVTKRNVKRVLTNYFCGCWDWGEAPDAAQIYGRQAQLAKLGEWVIKDRCRLVTIVGMGGIGKTGLATRLAKQFFYNGHFNVIVWRSLRQAPPLINLLTDPMQVLAPEQSPPERLDTMMRQLLDQLRHRRCLLILDNIEAVLSSSELVGTYRQGYENYSLLFRQFGEGWHQSSVLLTSREIPSEVSILEGPKAPVRVLRLEGVTIEEVKKIFEAKGLTIATEQPHVQTLIEYYNGNPLALAIVATVIRDFFNCDIQAFLAKNILLFKDIDDLLKEQFNRLSPLEREVMYWLVINQEPVTAKQLQADLMPDVSLKDFQDALISLNQRSLIEEIKPTLATPTALINLPDIRYTLQPVIMEYVIQQLIKQVCEELTHGQINCLRRHALWKAQAKDYVQDVQMRLIVQPILAKLLEVQDGNENLSNLLLQLLRNQRLQPSRQLGYFAGNALNLLNELGTDLSYRDFSNLVIWQANLQNKNLHGTNFSHSDLSQCIFTQSFSDVLCVAYSPNCKQFATSHHNGEVNVWQVKDGKPIATFRGIASWSKSIVFSQDSETLIIGNQDRTVKLLHIPSQTVRYELQGHTGAVLSLAISSDGHRLATGSEDKTIKIWDMQTHKCLHTLKGHQGWVSTLGACHFCKSLVEERE